MPKSGDTAIVVVTVQGNLEIARDKRKIVAVVGKTAEIAMPPNGVWKVPVSKLKPTDKGNVWLVNAQVKIATV